MKFKIDKTKNYLVLYGYLGDIQIMIEAYNERFPYGVYWDFWR